MSTERLLKPAQVAELLDVSLKTIYKWTHLGTIPVARAGRLLRFDESDVMNWLKRDEQKARKIQPARRERTKVTLMQKERAAAEVDSIIKAAISEVLD